MNIKIDGIKLTKSQQEAYNAAHNNDIKYLTLVWSRQSGKSTLMQLLCIEWLLKQNQTIIYITPTYSLAKTIFSKIQKLIPESLITKCNASDLILETIANSQLKFASGESAQSLRGNTATKLIIDEAAYIKEECDGQSFWYNIIMPITKVKCDKIILVSTPFGKSGFFYDHYLKGVNNEPNYKTLVKTIYDDALISKEDIEELRKGYPEMAWRCEFLCEFLTNALSVFPNYEDCFIDDFTFSKTRNNYIGVDLSTVGSDDTVVTVINDNNDVLQYNIVGDLTTKYYQIANIINSYNPINTYIESNGIGTVMFNEIIKYCKHKSKVHLYTTTNDTKQNYVGKLSTLIEAKHIAFCRSNEKLYEQLGYFTYKITNSKRLTFAASSGKHDDFTMSLLIALAAKDDANILSFTRNNYSFGKSFIRNAK